MIAHSTIEGIDEAELSGEWGGGGRGPVILQVLPELVTGGVERGTVDVAQAIVEAGGTALVASAGGPMVRELERVGVRHVTLPLASKNPLVIRANIGRLVELAKAERVDILHARSRAPAWSALFAAQQVGCHFMTTFHGTYSAGSTLKRRYNAVMTRGERVIAISEFIAAHVRTIYGMTDRTLRIVPRGVDIQKFDPTRVSPERVIQLARAWRLTDGVPVIMLPGRLTRWKGQLVLVEAMARFAAQTGRRDVRCILVGSDQGRTGYRREIDRKIEQLKLGDIVHVVDDCNDMPAAYKLADVVVSASTDPEAFGRVAVEAQAMGKPVIATDHGGSRETVLPGETGLLVPPGDAEALATAIGQALTLTSDERERLADHAIAHVRAKFSKELMCERTLRVYEEVLSEDPARITEKEAVPA